MEPKEVSPFKPGDIVVCVMGHCYPDGPLRRGRTYTVSDSIGPSVTLVGERRPFSHQRFDLLHRPKLAGTRPDTAITDEIEAEKTKETPQGLAVRPDHYTRFAIEPIEFILKNDLPFHKGNPIKYIARAGFKLYPGKDARESEKTDLMKAKRMIEMRLNQLDGKDIL